jgi:hypothetical protein
MRGMIPDLYPGLVARLHLAFKLVQLDDVTQVA